MKTYEQAIYYLANSAFGRYMSGCDDIWMYTPISAIAFCYGKTDKEVDKDLDTIYKTISDSYYKKK
jgi:hypothetical protein